MSYTAFVWKSFVGLTSTHTNQLLQYDTTRLHISILSTKTILKKLAQTSFGFTDLNISQSQLLKNNIISGSYTLPDVIKVLVGGNVGDFVLSNS